MGLNEAMRTVMNHLRQDGNNSGEVVFVQPPYETHTTERGNTELRIAPVITGRPFIFIADGPRKTPSSAILALQDYLDRMSPPKRACMVVEGNRLRENQGSNNSFLFLTKPTGSQGERSVRLLVTPTHGGKVTRDEVMPLAIKKT